MTFSCTALMYHALYANEEEWQALLDEEKPYAVSTQTFEMHLQLLQELNCEIVHPSSMQQDIPQALNENRPRVILTFDDGHRSNFTNALPILKKHQISALFFITTEFVNNDPRFCNWDELRALQKQGMLVHAHGHTHAFFADMDKTSAMTELRLSYELLTAQVAAPWSMSFPGGRYTQRDVVLAQSQGFSHIFTSDIGAINQAMFAGQTPIPRFAIKNTTTIAEFRAMARPTSQQLMKAKTIANAKTLIKRLLGNHFYHWLYTLKAGRGNKE